MKKLDDLQSVRTVINQKLEETRILSVGADRMEVQQIAPAQLPLQPIRPKVCSIWWPASCWDWCFPFSLPFYLQVMDSRIHTDMDLFKSTWPAHPECGQAVQVGNSLEPIPAQLSGPTEPHPRSTC
jgi:hypothetical protein